MKIGILAAGAPPRALIPRFGDYPAMFEALLDGEGDYAWRAYDVDGGELPAQPEDCEAYLITGSAHGAYDPDPWIADLKAFLVAAKGRAKLVGVCFGHQIMAEAFGGRVEKSSRGWGVGLHVYEVRERRPWMDDARRFALPASHQDQVVERPPGATVLAASDFCPFALLAYGDQPAISIQPHPEFSPEYATALIEGRRGDLISEDLAGRAISSLKGPNDRRRVGRWIARFLNTGAAAGIVRQGRRTVR